MSIQREERQSLFRQAADIARMVGEAATLKYPLQLVIPTNVAACWVRTEKEVFDTYGLSAFIKTEKHKGEVSVLVLVADNEEIALESLRTYKNNKEINVQLETTQYLALYRSTQAALKGQGKMITGGIEGLFLKLLETEDSCFEGLYDQITLGGAMTSEDLADIQGKLWQIWQGLPDEIKDSLGSIRPENVTNVL